MEKYNVESFNLDHTKVVAPFIRLAGTNTGKNGDVLHKFDVRFKQPNKEHMPMKSIHTLEHLLAENIRNYSDCVVDLSPMGCQTGFYLIMINLENPDEIFSIIEKTLEAAVQATEIPAQNEIQCGWAASHDLEGAKELAHEMLEKRSEWTSVFA